MTSKIAGETDRETVTAWVEQDGIREAMAVQIAADDGYVWGSLPEDQQTSFRATADNLLTIIQEWEVDIND